MNLAKVGVTGLVGAFLIFFIMTSPDNAANIVHASWHVVVQVAHGLRDFVDKLSS